MDYGYGCDGGAGFNGLRGHVNYVFGCSWDFSTSSFVEGLFASTTGCGSCKGVRVPINLFFRFVVRNCTGIIGRLRTGAQRRAREPHLNSHQRSTPIKLQIVGNGQDQVVRENVARASAHRR